ncbi:MAG: tRNA lysidine(34) synthetase TilS [Slackia sp.]|nr:tRNA lysidine(34) synthetase TilS [Slackia sp.]
MAACAACGAPADKSLLARVAEVTCSRGLASADTVALLMVSGGSDSTALAYVAAEMLEAGLLGDAAMLHVNHKLRGAASDGDAAFVERLASRLGIPLFMCDIDIDALVRESGGNMEAVARDQRYRAAREALESTCLHRGFALENGCVFTAHTADDRVENFYMRSIVGTGPGGFRSMDYSSMVHGCRVCRPLLEEGRDALRAYIEGRPDAVVDEAGARWREDATNADTDRFRAFVRHEIVPQAKRRNPQLLETLTRTMNLIADEDDMVASYARDLLLSRVRPLGCSPSEGFLIAPELAAEPAAIVRRVIERVLSLALGRDARIENASIEACAACLGASGAVVNIQGDLAVSYNKQGLRVEPMAAFRARRKKNG